MRFRRANVSDAKAVADLIKESFSDYHVQKMIYGCNGIVKYLEDQLLISNEVNDASTFVAELNDDICAVAQFKRDPKNKIFYLNYICTKKLFRRQKLGPRLIKYSLDNESFAFDYVVLDVFDNNTPAINWYIGLGFNKNEEKLWTLVDPADHEEGCGYLSGLPQSNICYREYGFSQLSLTTSTGTYSIGLLGEKYYRLSSASVFKDSAAIALLKKFDNGREFLLIGEKLIGAPDNYKINEFAKTLNMSVKKEILQKKLDVVFLNDLVGDI
jgi:ribosomal protein S18 acetylase RimI-like enzyme